MKVRILSDLHLEFEKLIIRNEGEDLLILCGDILPLNVRWGKRSRNRYLMRNFLTRYLRTCPNYIDQVDKQEKVNTKHSLPIRLILVLGNHDYYASRISSVVSFYKKLNDEVPGFKCLMNDTVTIPDPINPDKEYFFVGSTLWGDLSQLKGKDLELIGHNINDFHCIYDEHDKLITPNYIKRVHTQNKLFIKNSLLKSKIDNDFHSHLQNDQNKEIIRCVITHHLVSYRSVNPKFADQHLLNHAYVGNLEHLCSLTDYFFHGHTHSSNDYILTYDPDNDETENWGSYEKGSARVICNPKGYKSENKDFDLKMIVEI